MINVYNDDSIYVCITHQCVIPCVEGDQHLISNWKSDVEKILEMVNNNGMD
jgi:hypothetical protein